MHGRSQMPAAVAQVLSPAIGIPAPILEVAGKRRTYGIIGIDQQIIDDQQKIADTFYQVKLIPKAISIKDAVLAKVKP